VRFRSAKYSTTIRFTKGVTAGSVVLGILQIASPTGASQAAVATTPTPENSQAPARYTFHMVVVMAMRHFPWLHFRLEGVGDYAAGQTYVVHFTTLPWFVPKQHHDADLSMLDPVMWPKRFTYQEIGQRNGETLFALHALNDSTLKSAIVALGPYWHARTVDSTYTDGTHVQMSVNSSNVSGFFLPVTLTAQIDEPHLALSASADFTDYDFAAQQQPLNDLP
jgi:hypothetical protein